MKHLTFLIAFLFTAVSSFGQAPSDNATDPPARDSENVISIFSGAYTDVSGSNYNPNWGQSGFSTANTSFDPGTGNIVLAYPNFNYQGNVLGSVQDISSMEFLHVDIWVNSTFNPNVFAISSGAEIAHSITNTGARTWISVDIPVSGITGDPTQVKELKFDGGNGSTDSIYVDNIYFWKNATTPQSDATLSDLKVDGETIANFSAGVESYKYGLVAGTTTIPQITAATSTNANATVTITQASAIPGDATVKVVSEDETDSTTYTVSYAITSPAIAAPAPPVRDSSNVISIYSNAYSSIALDALSAGFDDSDVTEVMIEGNSTLEIDFTNFIGIDFSSNKQDASAMTHFHLDFWTSSDDLVGKVFNSKFSQWGGTGGEVSAFELPINTGTTPAIESGKWVSIDVPISDWTNAPQTRDDIAQFLITSNMDVVYVDNIYLYKEGGSSVGNQPMVAAPAPPVRDSEDVISIYSDVYSNIALDALSAGFDDSDVAEVMIEGNSTLEIDFTNFVGIDFSSNKQDASAMTHFHMDFWTSSSDLTGKVFNSKFSHWGGTSGEVSAFELPINTGTSPAIESGKWISIDVPISDWTNAPQTRDDIAQFLITSNLDTVYVDNIYLYKEEGVVEPGGELLTNGDFESGDDGSWFGNAFNIQTEGGNSFNFADVATAGNTFDVNLSQGVAIAQGETYILTFDASTSTGNTRSILAGIGLNEGDFTSATETVNLTETTQTFMLELTATGFGSANSRVLFDMGAETGIVVIDNVSLTVKKDEDPTEGLLTNGDFELGDDGSWFGNALNIQTEGGNSFNFADVATAGNAFDVNLSQGVPIIQGQTYVLTFEASTSTGNTRSILAGIGLNEGDFTSATETVNLTETIQTFVLELTATGFGSANSRVLFDMGAETGIVVIDNVTLDVKVDTGGELLTNGDFELGDDGSWFGNAFNIQTEGGNSFNFADVATAGNAFDVNLSNGVAITQGESYILTFEASTSPGNTRSMIAGIGLNEGDFTAAIETVNLTETTQTFVLELTANGFGSANSRVLFDMGAETGIVVIDNVSLIVDDGSTADPAPMVAAPAPPQRNAEDVISLYSDAYADIEVDTLSATFDDSFVEEIMIEGDNTLKIDFTNFVGVDFSGDKQDASGMTHFHLDFWTAEEDLIGKVFNLKFSQWGGTDGEVSAFELPLNTGTTPAVESGKWISVDVPISDWTNAPQTRDDIAQFLITSNLDVVYVDNVYLYKGMPVSIENPNDVPATFALDQNYPNPFNPSTNISYSIPENGKVSLEVYNIQGQKVTTLVNEQKSAGSYTVTFDASNLASGVYMYRLVSKNSVQVRKMLLIK
jgi:hypothetical protein